jgi:Lhr-like helicase
MSIRTRFEIETFVLGAHPTPARKAQALTSELMQAREQQHPDLPVLEAVYKDFSEKHDVDALLADIEGSEEEYWVHRLAKLAAIDILTLGKVQPEHMNYMVALQDEAFSACVKEATSIAKQLNYEVQQIEAELQSELASEK